MHSPLVSVIVPCYNQGQFLAEALDSILKQTYSNWECIIINDGSSDNTGEIAIQWCAFDLRFIYISNTNQGISKTRNAGIALAKGDYILPLDGDDKISDNYIEECVDAIKEEGVKVVYGSSLKFGIVDEVWELSNFDFEYLLFSNMIYCTGLYSKKDFMVTSGGYDENMEEGYEDWEFWINLLKNGGLAKRIDSITFFYRIKTMSRMTNISLIKRYKLIAYMMYKHGELYEKYLNDYAKPININFSYCLYLSALTYHGQNADKIEKTRNYYHYKLLAELSKYGFFERKKILFYWYRRGKCNLSLLDVLVY